MPPRNPNRALLTESALAARVAAEREKRGWTYEGLAVRMGQAGCPINQSGLYKIEKGEPRRRITVDELVAFSEVFQVPVDQLLLPPDLALSREAAVLLIAWYNAQSAEVRAKADTESALASLKEHVAQHPEIVDRVEEQVAKLRVHYYGPQNSEFSTALDLLAILDDSDRREPHRETVRTEMDRIARG